MAKGKNLNPAEAYRRSPLPPVWSPVLTGTQARRRRRRRSKRTRPIVSRRAKLRRLLRLRLPKPTPLDATRNGDNTEKMLGRPQGARTSSARTVGCWSRNGASTTIQS